MYRREKRSESILDPLIHALVDKVMVDKYTSKSMLREDIDP